MDLPRIAFDDWLALPVDERRARWAIASMLRPERQLAGRGSCHGLCWCCCNTSINVLACNACWYAFMGPSLDATKWAHREAEFLAHIALSAAPETFLTSNRRGLHARARR